MNQNISLAKKEEKLSPLYFFGLLFTLKENLDFFIKIMKPKVEKK